MDSKDMQTIFSPQSARSELFHVFSRLQYEGDTSAPRGLPVKEITAFTMTFSPYVRYSSFLSRQFKLDYLKREMQWYLWGNPNDARIDHYAKTWASIRDRGEIQSNYGKYLFADGQLEQAINQLTADPDSRRASVVILQPHHLVHNAPDVPCTYSMNFRIRSEGYLECSVHMRSQDVIFGMGNDLPTFSFVQEIVAAALEVPVGHLTMHVDSLHVYERHFNMIKAILFDGQEQYQEIHSPAITKEEAYSLLKWHKQGPVTHYPFTSWLLEAPL